MILREIANVEKFGCLDPCAQPDMAIGAEALRRWRRGDGAFMLHMAVDTAVFRPIEHAGCRIQHLSEWIGLTLGAYQAFGVGVIVHFGMAGNATAVAHRFKGVYVAGLTIFCQRSMAER